MAVQERVIGCFKALATGDAIGKQTEMLSRPDVQRWYPGGITGFHGQPGEVIPRYAGKRYEWRIGETTDDTEQTLAVARALLRVDPASHKAIGQELLRCKKSLHPGVSLWNFVQLGDPSRMASEGDGCGAAMRAAPVGVLYPSSRLDELIRGAYECAIPTHGGQMAVCAAAAVAGAVSAALDGRPSAEVLTVAIRASTKAESLRPRGQASSTIAAAIQGIYSDLVTRKHLAVDELANQYFRHDVLAGLVNGCHKVQGQQGYYRAISGMRTASPGAFDRAAARMPNTAQRLLRDAELRKIIDVPRVSFESMMRKRTRTALGMFSGIR